MIYHVLPGDAQVDVFRLSGIEGEVLVCREALVEGDVRGDSLDELFINRAAFHNESSGEDPASYNANVASQFRRLLEVTEGDEVDLWFEYDLFCAVNMWFCIDLLSDTAAELYRVEPIYLSEHDRWDGFGGATTELLRQCLSSRIRLAADDLVLGSTLWQAFSHDDEDRLRSLSNEISPAFPYLSDIVRAAIDRRSRPREILDEITAAGATDLGGIFPEFKKRAGIYGFGDSQVKRLLGTM